MNIENEKYAQIRGFIEKQYKNGKEWESIKKLDYMPGETFESLSMVAITNGLEINELTENIWIELVLLVENRYKKVNVVKLGKYIRNNATISDDSYSAWQSYKKKLITQNWSEESILSIEKSSYDILQRLSMNTIDDGPVKGLVVGNVQSGKTANMAGLMAMAADNGFNYFIILSGVIENLRQQTANRLFSDMNSTGKGNLHWKLIDNPTLKSKAPEHDLSEFNLGENAKDRYFTVCLKNSKRLKNLISWLYSDINKAKQLKVLIIDDEADQASINTKKIEEEDQTKINKLIRDLVNTKKIQGMNYIAYTATPYANVLNETDERSLYPKDFIVLLEPSEDYMGPKQFFGTEEPEAIPQIDIIRDISIKDVEIMNRIQDVDSVSPLPFSMKNSINWFMLTVAAMRALDYRKPISMLIHTSFKITHHQNIAQNVAYYLSDLKKNYTTFKKGLRDLYADETVDFKRSHFLDGMRNYSTKESVPNYPSWEEVEKHLDRLVRLPENEFLSNIPIGEEGEPMYHKGFHLVIDNSKAQADDQIVRLVYPKSNQTFSTAPAFIVIGGNTLSRGLTLEGLTSTYFLRTTTQADTLMQMGRWFGYRKGYEIFPRVWLDRKALERFQFLAQMNEELREEITSYADNGLTPLDYAPRIKNSVDRKLIRITSSNKMQSSEPKDYDFAGFNTQTVYFENDVDILKSNLSHTSQFLNNLNAPQIKDNYMIWRNINVENIISFLNGYKVCDSDIKMSSIPALIEWTQKNSKNLANWSVVLASKGKVGETKGKDKNWNIHGYSPGTSTRTKLKSRSSDKVANIGALRGPADLYADIEDSITSEERNKAKASEIRTIREKYGYGKVPQIIIYKVDKGSMTEEEYLAQFENVEVREKKSKRAPLNFSLDIIGINVLIPGLSKGGDMATYITAKLSFKDVDEEFSEDDE